MDTKEYYILLSSVEGLGARWIMLLDRTFGGPERAWNASEAELKSVPRIPRKVIDGLLTKRERIDPEKELNSLREKGIETVFIDDPVYPQHLRHIYDPPKILYVRGNIDVLQLQMFAVVGARKASPYGLSVAQSVSRDLAEAGLCVVSGMARGIDTAAHRGALGVDKPTVAVLGCGVDVVYPRENKKVMEEIIDKGAVISEFPPGTAPMAGNFPVRNRIISGLSRGILVVEAADKSGSLITADLALEQGRDVFAVPGQVTNSVNRGAHRLIKQGAKLVEDAGDILEDFGYSFFAKPATGEKQADLTGDEKKIYNIISDDPVSSETIIVKTGFNTSQVLAILLELELRGLVSQLPGQRYIRSVR